MPDDLAVDHFANGPSVTTAAPCRHLGVPLSTVRIEILDYGGPKRPFRAVELARVRHRELRGS